MAFVRTQCDNSIRGISDELDCTDEEAFTKVKEQFREFVNTKVLSQVNMSEMEIYYIGLPISKYTDFNRIVARILNGSLLLNDRIHVDYEVDSDRKPCYQYDSVIFNLQTIVLSLYASGDNYDKSHLI